MTSKLNENQRAYLDGYCRGFEGLNDGAWIAATQEACEEAVERNPADLFTGMDPHDLWTEWALGQSS